MATSRCSSCSHRAVSWKSCWMCFFFCFCQASAGGCGGAWLAVGRHNRRCLSCTVCRQCTTDVLCGSCLSHVQICVCVSRFMRWLPLSKSSLRQSASAVTKLLSSPAGASCPLVKKTEQLCVDILNSHKNPALRHNRDFNIATAQRQPEAMQTSIWITEICSSDTRSCSSRIYVEYLTTSVEYLPSCRKMQYLQRLLF